MTLDPEETPPDRPSPGSGQAGSGPSRRRVRPRPSTEGPPAEPPPAPDESPEAAAPADAWDDLPPESPYYETAPEDESLLRNPYVLAGLAVAVAIFLAALVVVFSGGGGSGGDDGLVIAPLTPAPGRGVAAKSIASATVRDGPGPEYAGIGTLRSGVEVEVVGRNDALTWFQIYYPVRSRLPGWVPATALDVPDAGLSLIQVVAVTPIVRPTVAQPTLPPEPTQTETPTPTVTGTPAASPDLALSVLNNNCTAGADLIVVVTNKAQTRLDNRSISITVATPGGGIIATKSISLSLDPGGSVNLPTDVKVQAPRTSVKLDLLGSPPEGNLSNNVVDCVVQGPTAVPPPIGSPTPTRTPTAAP